MKARRLKGDRGRKSRPNLHLSLPAKISGGWAKCVSYGLKFSHELCGTLGERPLCVPGVLNTISRPIFHGRNIAMPNS